MSLSRPAGGGPHPPGDAVRRVLVVDDDPSIVEVVAEMFATHDYAVHEAADATGAMSILREQAVDAVITDLSLGGESGLDVLRFARGLPDPPVVVLISGYGTMPSAIGAYRDGALDFIPKPFDLTRLTQVVERGLDARDLERENRRLLKDLTEANLKLRSHEAALESEVSEATERLLTLYEMAGQATAKLEWDATLSMIVTNACRLVDAEVGALYLPDPESGDLIWAAGSGGALDGSSSTTAPRPVHGGAVYQALYDRRARRWRPSGSATVDEPEELSAVITRGAIIAPLEFKGEVAAVLVVGDCRRGRFDDDDEKFLVAFASQAANALGNAREHEALRDVEKMKTDFVAMVSHELRTPITAVKGSLDLLARSAGDTMSDDELTMLGICQTNTRRLLSIVNNILDFSRLEASTFPVHLEPTDLESAVRSAVRDIRKIADDAGIELVVDIPEPLPEVPADELRIAQVVTNLLSNAIKFSDAETTVRVAAGPHPEGVVVTVHDRGCGIRAGDVPRLFRRFSQLEPGSDRRAGGTGLGLVISQSIVEAHGGRMQVESREGVGSSFGFVLPGPSEQGPDVEPDILAGLS